VTASVSSFVPKPGTPFQWAPMCSRDEIRRRQSVVRGGTRMKSVKLKFHNPETSYLEGILARGDRRLGAVIEHAWRGGARFEAWSEHMKLDLWLAAFAACGLDPDWFALRARRLDEILPWVCVSDAVSTEFLKRELARSGAGQTTGSCADTDPGKDAPCFVCDACARSPNYRV
jgi:hypothetical protein